ncbi:nitroreductase family deazaflavin-dependent oxidoreductase [Salsipaludibacter albus]|uniref:nitroreductase family deazaflavin-dependent oxidoreductase n=1 Tax=Salsipaludibacter albus TaxID=2849650 RepID=UPI001EE3BBC7|nr:nitroreductase family deazaflavin-dependent oxidoreductase [Salsipaludibacter albus]MBY5162177.1 nitroreductase family deazaflavin-dependent oxidoreductase [Salsipaludibacter albus]
MPLPDAFSLRQKPTGFFKALLRAPVWLYRWDLGRLLGTRFLLITHRGRRSGDSHQTVVEVVHHDVDQGEWVVCSGTGPQADWYRNLVAAPAEAVQVGDRSWTPAQRFLDDEEAAATYHAYETAHPRTARRLLQSMGNSYDGTHAGRVAMMADMPMVAFSDTALDPGTT